MAGKFEVNDNKTTQADMASNAVTAKLLREANPQQVHEPPLTENRGLSVTMNGLGYAPRGIVNAAVHEATHPLEMAETVAGGAVFGAGLKMVLPEGGAVSKFAALGIGALYLYENWEPFSQAYKKGSEAKTQAELDAAAKQWGSAAGNFTVSSLLAGGGVKVGSMGAKRVLATESMDNFVVKKEVFWDPVERKTAAVLPDFIARRVLSPEAIQRSQTLGLRPKWEVNGRQATLTDSIRSTPKGEKLGEIAPDEKFGLTVYARSLDSTGRLLDRRLQRISDGKAGFVDDVEMQSKFGANPKSVEAITKWAQDNKLDVGKVDMRTGRMSIAGTHEQMQQALGTRFDAWQSPDGVMHRARTGAYKIDAEVAPHVESILGGDNRPTAMSRRTPFIPLANLPDAHPAGAVGPKVDGAFGAKAEAAAAPPVRPVEVVDLARARGITPDMDGAGKVIGIGELGGDLDIADNKIYYTSRGLEQPEIIKKGVDGHVPESDGPNGADGEVALDTVIAGAVAPKARQVVAFGENSDAGFPNTHNEMAFPTDNAPAANVISWSWGQHEDAWTPQAMRSLSMAFKRSAAKGITTFVAAGDDGAIDNNPARRPTIDFPAGDPNVSGVGGTQVVISGGKIAREVAWNDGTHSASGGGISRKIPRPDFQKGMELPPEPTGSKFDGRGVPDVAENASPRSGYIIRVDGQEGATGGTSGGSPFWSAATAGLSSKLGRDFGNMNGFFYRNAKSGMFNDITSGDNNGHKTGPGWDAVTGWGSADFGKLLDVLKTDSTGKNNLKDIFPAGVKGSGDQTKNTKPNAG